MNANIKKFLKEKYNTIIGQQKYQIIFTSSKNELEERMKIKTCKMSDFKRIIKSAKYF